MRTVVVLLFLSSNLLSQDSKPNKILPKNLKWSNFAEPYQIVDTNFYHIENGLWLDTNNNQQVFFEIQNNLLEGLVTVFNDKLEKISETEYKKGQKTGIDKSYINNKLSRLDQKNNGDEIESQVFYQNGTIKKRFTTLKDSFFTPKVFVSEYYENGCLKFAGFMTTGGKNDLWNAYHSNCEIESIGNYLFDKKVGRWRYYNLNGREIKTEFYTSEGKLTEKYEWDYIEQNGKIKQIEKK